MGDLANTKNSYILYINTFRIYYPFQPYILNHKHIHTSIHSHIYIFKPYSHHIHLYIYTSIHLYTYTSIHLYIYTPIHLYIHPMFRYQPIVCMHQINVKTNEPIGPNFFVATHITQRKVYGRIKVEIVPKKRQLNLFYRNVFRKVCNIINKRNKIGLVYCANAPQIF